MTICVRPRLKRIRKKKKSKVGRFIIFFHLVTVKLILFLFIALDERDIEILGYKKTQIRLWTVLI